MVERLSEITYTLRRTEKTMFYNKLYEEGCVFIVPEKPRFICNCKVNGKVAHLAASVQYLLEHAELKLANQYQTPRYATDSPEAKALFGRIEDLSFELHNLMIMMTESARIEYTDKEQRYIFRIFGDKREADRVMLFIRQFNKWTSSSAEYLVTEARKAYDDEKFRQHLEKANDQPMYSQIEMARKNLAAEYDRKLDRLRWLLSGYVSDLYSIVNELNEQYGLMKQLESMQENLEDFDF